MNLGLVLPDDPFPPVPLGWAAVVAVAVATALFLAFVGRNRLPTVANAVLLAVCGAAIGLGAGAIERAKDGGVPNVGEIGGEWLTAVAILAVLTPLHVRVVLGPLGRKG